MPSTIPSVPILKPVHRRLKAFCKKRGLKMQTEASAAVEEHMARKEAEEEK